MWLILQIFTAAFRAREDRDWTKEETLALFHDLQHSEVIPKKFNRTPKECSYHYRHVVATFFECFGNSPIEGIERAVKEFYAKPQQALFTEELTRDMMIRFLINRKSIVKGPDQHIEKCDAHYRKLMELVFKRLGYSSSDEAILAAINTFYTKRNRKTKRRSKSRRRTCWAMVLMIFHSWSIVGTRWTCAPR